MDSNLKYHYALSGSMLVIMIGCVAMVIAAANKGLSPLPIIGVSGLGVITLAILRAASASGQTPSEFFKALLKKLFVDQEVSASLDRQGCIEQCLTQLVRKEYGVEPDRFSVLPQGKDSPVYDVVCWKGMSKIFVAEAIIGEGRINVFVDYPDNRQHVVPLL